MSMPWKQNLKTSAQLDNNKGHATKPGHEIVCTYS